MASTDKRALLIGINKYMSPQVKDLAGCVHDVELLAKTLRENFLFPKENITLLRDQEATRKGILAAFAALVDETGEDDIVVFHYSGHGSQVRWAPDSGTDPEDDESRDETIVPHDGRVTAGSMDVLDDEIHEQLLAPLSKKTRFLTLVFDSCHSGSVIRDGFGDPDRRVEPLIRQAKAGETKKPRKSRKEWGTSGWLPLSDSHVLLASCQDNELSYEMEEPSKQGALTYFLVQHLTTAQSGATYREIFEKTCRDVTGRYTHQHPQIEGEADREIFGIREIVPMSFIPVEARSGTRVTLGGGAAHGMTVGSKWAIYPPGTRETDGKEPLGTVRIRTVGALTAEGTLEAGGERLEIVADCRAVETVHNYGDLQLRVRIEASAAFKALAAKLQKEIQTSKLLRIVTSGPADLLVRSPEGAGAEQVWTVVEQGGGRLLTAPLEHLPALRDNLEKQARFEHARTLRNPDRQGAIEGKVEMKLLRRQGDGWAEAKGEGPAPEFQHGDRLGIEIVNHHSAPVYVSLLDFGLDGEVLVLYPFEAPSQQVPAKETVRFFANLSVPEAVFADRDLETYRLFVTSRPTDFRPLAQKPWTEMRGASLDPAAYDQQIEKILSTILTGLGDNTERKLAPKDRWSVVEQTFFLRKK